MTDSALSISSDRIGLDSYFYAQLLLKATLHGHIVHPAEQLSMSVPNYQGFPYAVSLSAQSKCCTPNFYMVSFEPAASRYRYRSYHGADWIRGLVHRGARICRNYLGSRVGYKPRVRAQIGYGFMPRINGGPRISGIRLRMSVLQRLV